MIVGISGRKQAGKNTTANILHGIILKKEGFIKEWSIGGEGQLMIDSTDGSGWGEFDITRQDEQFAEWADYNMWPFVKLYSFADHLKWICIKLFDIPYECVWGTDEQKNQIQEHLVWENMPVWSLLVDNTGPMTAREFMQYLGTDIMRKMYEPIWVNACIKKIQQEQSELAIIADVRFPNEAKAIEQAGGKVVRLTRKVHEDNHSSEVALDDYPFTDYIDNKIESIDVLMVKVTEFYRKLKE
jgi:hypothetical protein|tara:strand:- start:11421 stop:12146 length:726 start_codon:yes stop_codon:yes gene_type:complete